MRLFIAIDVPFFSELNDIQGVIKKLRPKVNWTSHFHITLKFLGERHDVSEIIDRLRNVEYSKFKVTLKDLGYFPEKGKIRVFWVGTTGTSFLKKLHSKMESALEDFDVREFQGHVTLGRVKFVKNEKGFKDYLKTVKIPKKQFEVSSFKLYKSELTSEGPKYEVVEEFELK